MQIIAIKAPNNDQIADRKYLIETLTPTPPGDVAAQMDGIHATRGRNAQCGCAECVDAYGNSLEVEVD